MIKLTEKQKKDLKYYFPSLSHENVEYELNTRKFERTRGKRLRIINGTEGWACCGNCEHIHIRDDHGFGMSSCVIERIMGVLEYGSPSNFEYNDLIQCCDYWQLDYDIKEELEKEKK